MRFIHEFDKADEKNESIDHKFATTSTLHGLRNIVESKHHKGRVAWIILFLICIGYLIYNVILLIDEFAKFNAVSEITIKVWFKIFSAKTTHFSTQSVPSSASTYLSFSVLVIPG